MYIITILFFFFNYMYVYIYIYVYSAGEYEVQPLGVTPVIDIDQRKRTT